jgi:hypothetical protein
MQLRRTATTLALAIAMGTGLAACDAEEAGRDAGKAVDKGAKEAEKAGKKAAGEVDKAVDGKKE